ncbi:MAG: lysophospholipid acyltransferase family protein [Balneolaceae bacterium]
MAFTFKKNERGYSEITFPFMRKVIIGTTQKLFNVRITNPENMPLTGPCFLYGNHSNYFDPFFLNVGLTREPTAGVMTRDQFHRPIRRIFMDSIGIVPTSKYVPEPGIVRSVIKMIGQNRIIVIFPEGGRRWDGRPKPLIETTLKLFWKMKIPVHPIQLHGSHLAWPRWAKRPRLSSVEARFLTPLHSSDFDNYEAFAEACRSKLDFEEYNPPEEAKPIRAWKPASGIHRLLYRCPETGESATVFTPDGKRVLSRAHPFRYRMDHHSRLIDPDGQSHSVVEMYDRIKAMEMEFLRDDCLLEELGSQFYTIGKEHELIKLDRGVARLRETHLDIYYGSVSEQIPLEEIRAVSIEQNHKISITDAQRTIQFTMKHNSVLQWQHYLRRLAKGEKAVRSL